MWAIGVPTVPYFTLWCFVELTQGSDTDFLGVMIIIPALALSFGGLVWLFSKFAFVENETRKRGAWVGGFAALFGLYAALFILTIIFEVHDYYVFSDGIGDFWPGLLEDIKFYPLLLIMATFYGGFFAPLIGALLGYYLCRDTQK